MVDGLPGDGPNGGSVAVGWLSPCDAQLRWPVCCPASFLHIHNHHNKPSTYTVLLALCRRAWSSYPAVPVRLPVLALAPGFSLFFLFSLLSLIFPARQPSLRLRLARGRVTPSPRLPSPHGPSSFPRWRQEIGPAVGGLGPRRMGEGSRGKAEGSGDRPHEEELGRPLGIGNSRVIHPAARDCTGRWAVG